MADFLIVHEAGQGAWFWNRVWGHMTVPVEHPPRLYKDQNAYQHCLLNLPGHGSDEQGDTAEVRLEECVQAIVHTVERRGLRNLTLVGHGLGGMLVLLAAPLLSTPPKRLALVAGIVPEDDGTALPAYPYEIRKLFSPGFNLRNLWAQELRLTPSVIARYLCNGMEPQEITRALGFFGALPTRVMKAKAAVDWAHIPSPITYVMLDQDRLFPPDIQVKMARRIPGVDIVHLDSCHQAGLHKPQEAADILLNLT